MHKSLVTTGSRPWLALALCAGISGCAEPDAPSSYEEVESQTEELLLIGATWPNGQVPVCWSIDPNPKGKFPLTTLTAAQKQRVRDVLAASWPRVAHIDFTGWGNC